MISLIHQMSVYDFAAAMLKQISISLDMPDDRPESKKIN